MNDAQIIAIHNANVEYYKSILEKLEKLATITIECLPEDQPIKGNASAIDDETDKKVEQNIIDQLESGNEWAWCTIKVTASYAGLSGVDYLGACSYKSKEDFINDGCYKDMVICAIDDLYDNIKQTKKELGKLGMLENIHTGVKS